MKESESQGSNKTSDIDVMWGGYYASQEEGNDDVTIFRLLDFNSTAYHAALFTEKFKHSPSIDEVNRLSPFISHAPIDVRGFLRRSITLIGSTPLIADDLKGYMVYLEHHEVSIEERDRLLESIIKFSRQPPLELRLELHGEELSITER